jgi:hypothetical protein
MLPIQAVAIQRNQRHQSFVREPGIMPSRDPHPYKHSKVDVKKDFGDCYTDSGDLYLCPCGNSGLSACCSVSRLGLTSGGCRLDQTGTTCECDPAFFLGP